MRVRLCESLIDESFTIKIPVQMKFRTTSTEEDLLIDDLETQLLDVIQDELEHAVDDALYPLLQNYAPKITDIIQSNVEVHHLYLYLNVYNDVLSSDGEITVEIFLDQPADSSLVKNAFNTLLNNKNDIK